MATIGLRPCAPPGTSFFDAIFSDDYDWCTESQRTEVNRLMNLPVNKGNTSGVPYCDPTSGTAGSLFSNTCNSNVPAMIVDEINQIGEQAADLSVMGWGTIGLAIGAGILGVVVVTKLT